MKINLFFKSKSKKPESTSENILLRSNNFSEAIKLITERRVELGYSIQELSNRTKISSNVLNSIEAGLKGELPEETYLNSMFKTLEVELGLEENSLVRLIRTKNTIKRKKVKIIPNGNIILHNTWQGTLVYILLLAIFILFLNRYQRHLSIINSQTTFPVEVEDLN